MITKKIKNLKPTEYNIHIKYTCPVCDSNHWISEKEASYEKFVIVCDCDSILKPKTIESIRCRYKKKIVKQQPSVVITPQVLDNDILKRCCVSLEAYGFSIKEAENLIQQSYRETNSQDCIFLVKHSLLKLGEDNGTSYEAD